MKKIILVLLLLGLVFYLSSLDVQILEELVLLRKPVFTFIALLFAFMGSWRFLLPFNILFALYFKKEKPYNLLVPLGTLGCWIINHLIKETFRRPRPQIPALAIENSFSFPSGHAMVTSCFVLLLAYFIKEQWGKDIPIPATLYIGTMLLSRLYLGVHYPSDVFVGAALGLATAWALQRYFGGKHDRSNNKG
jgi:undecaprenyl-diphosphatase